MEECKRLVTAIKSYILKNGATTMEECKPGDLVFTRFTFQYGATTINF
mgnify:CR=1 FL=1